MNIYSFQKPYALVVVKRNLLEVVVPSSSNVDVLNELCDTLELSGFRSMDLEARYIKR
jgi:hypothetical protein